MADRIGSMRERVKIQAEGPTADGGGGYANAWATVATVWARVQPLRGTEDVAAARRESRIQYRVTIRRYAGLTAKHRLLWGSTPLEILDIRNMDERGAYYELDCIAGGAT